MANPAPSISDPSDSVPDVPRISGQHLVSVEGTASTLASDSAVGAAEALQSLVRKLPRFDDRLVDLGLIAQGGMGVIHRVWDEILNRELALKILQGSEHSFEAAQRFVVEARVTALLDHPSIVPVYDLGTYKGSTCFLMKLVEGITLQSEIAGGPRWGVSTACDVWLLEAFMKVCDAVSFAHSRSIIHRDLKPENIMLGSFSQVYVMDWGVALTRQDGNDGLPEGVPAPRRRLASAPPAFAGTLSYMAPEQALAALDQIDERTDVFLLGGVLYEMFTGCTPHPPTQNIYASVYAAVSCDVPPCQQLRPDLAPELGEIVTRALSREPDARYASPLELKAALREALGGLNLPGRGRAVTGPLRAAGEAS